MTDAVPGGGAYDMDFQRLRQGLTRMAELVDRQIGDAVAVLDNGDPCFARAVRQRDARMRGMEHELDALCLWLLALRRPFPADLRLILVALKVSHDLRRVGHLAAGMAARCVTLSLTAAPVERAQWQRMARLARAALAEAVAALVAGDTSLARGQCDHQLKQPASSQITYGSIAPLLEQIKVHANDMAEQAYFAACGADLFPRPPRPWQPDLRAPEGPDSDGGPAGGISAAPRLS